MAIALSVFRPEMLEPEALGVLTLPWLTELRANLGSCGAVFPSEAGASGCSEVDQVG